MPLGGMCSSLQSKISSFSRCTVIRCPVAFATLIRLRPADSMNHWTALPPEPVINDSAESEISTADFTTRAACAACAICEARTKCPPVIGCGARYNARAHVQVSTIGRHRTHAQRSTTRHYLFSGGAVVLALSGTSVPGGRRPQDKDVDVCRVDSVWPMADGRCCRQR
eukprot:4347326-Prymnesium_polylepis.2